MVASPEHYGGVDYSSPVAFSQTQTAGFSPTMNPITPGHDMSIIGGNGAAASAPDSSMNTCSVFQTGGGRRKRKAKRSRKLRRSNKSRLSSKSRKSRSKSRSKVKKLSKKSLRKSKRNKRKSLR